MDGTGKPAVVADVAISGRTILAIGKDLPMRGAREIDAHGLLVTPGWVDPHTHFDGQVTWDPFLTPSGQCGVTTLIMGNCGIGFAPCAKEMRNFLVDLMDAVEDIPGSALNEGMTWKWETFADYLAALESSKLVCDVGVMVGHSPVRTWVLGHRAAISDRPGGPENAPVKPDEIEKIAKVVEESVAAGALGFSTSRVILHRDKSGVLVPGTLAAEQEMTAISDAVARGGGGVMQVNTQFDLYDDVQPSSSHWDRKRAREHFKSEWTWIRDSAIKHRDTVTFTTGIGCGIDPGSAYGFRQGLKMYESIKAQGGKIIGQVFSRPGGILFSFKSGLHPFMGAPTLKRLTKEAAGSFDAFVQSLRQPEHRAAIIAESEGKTYKADPNAGIIGFLRIARHMTWPFDASYEPDPKDAITARAEREGRTWCEVMYDLLLDIQGPHHGILWRPQFNYAMGDHEIIRELLSHDQCIPGFADGGAHVRFVQDATAATHLLTHFVRDRSRGPKMPIEMLVKKQTADSADMYGLSDRGRLLPGLKADLNLIDLDSLKVLTPEWVSDLPLGASRWTQGVEGYRMTIVSGTVTYENGMATGAMPGTLVRNPHAVGLADPTGSVPPVRSSTAEDLADLKDHALSVSSGEHVGFSALGRLAKQGEQQVPSRL